MSRTRLPFAAALALLALLGACKKDESAPPAKEPRLSVEELKDPETCKSCHPTHYREWKASMHAYASEDPVFTAMNALGQEETNGELGDFCLKCHAPMAVKEGLVDGGLLAEDTPEHLKGVTCYFCHNVESVSGDTNAEVTLANDDVMRGGIIDPVEPSAHGVRFSRFMDRYNPESSNFCGGCHDIALENGVHLERTFAEYKESIFAQHGTVGFLSCSGCHMPNRVGLAAIDDGLPGEEESVGTRDVHSHLWPGVDVALTSWPDRDEYEAAVACALDQSINLRLGSETGPDDTGGVRYVFETQAGHKQPSGASQDRRMWVEMIAYAGDEVLCSLGAVPDDLPVAGFQEHMADEQRIACSIYRGASTEQNTNFPLFRDRIFDEDGEETHMFWRAAPSEEIETGVQSRLLTAATMRLPDGSIAPHTEIIGYDDPGPTATRITVRLKMRGMDYDVLDELIEAGVLAEDVRGEIRTFTLASASVDFERSGGTWVAVPVPGRNTDCYDAFFCAFDPDAPDCD